MSALLMIGALLLAGALALGGGGALLLWAAGGLAGAVLPGLALALLYTTPGLLLLRALWPRDHALGWAERLGLAIGLSVALPPLLLLLAQQVRLPWGAPATWGYVALCTLGWAALAARDARRERVLPTPDAPSLVLLGVALAGLLVRLYAVRNVPVGLLGDSYQHTLMAQLLVDHQGLFQSWQPYAPLKTFTYHFGFHANVAFTHYLTGIDVPRSLVLAGQVLNALTIPLVFTLLRALGGSRWAGVWAALVVGFVGNMPAFFVNWGRYTQLAGQIVLMALVMCWVALAHYQEPRAENREPFAPGRFPWLSLRGFPYRLALLAALATAGMMLTHYLVTVLAALFVMGYLVMLVLARRDAVLLGRIALRALPTAAVALVLALPWLLNVLRGQLLRNANGMVSGGSGKAVITQMSALEPVAPRYVGGAVLVLALLGLLVAGWRRDWRMALPALWAALLVLIVIPYVVGLPGAGVIDTVTGLGTLFIPAALLAGYALGSAQEALGAAAARFHLPAALPAAVAGVALLATLAATTGRQAAIVSGETALVSDADLAAIAWIKANTPADARFLVNSFPAYGGTLATGSDAGWWLPLLAGRWASLPPLTYGSEQGEIVNYQKHLNNFIVALRGRPLSDPSPVLVDLTKRSAWRAVRSAGTSYVYNGAHPYPGPHAVDRFDSAILRADPRFTLVYDQGGVEIYQINLSTQ